MDLRQEKLDEMREDMLIEAKMREDLEYCIEQYQSLDTLIVAFKGLQKHLAHYDHDMTDINVFREFREYL